MTEEEWLASDNLADLLDAVNLGERKLRLLAAACARIVWQWLDDEGSRTAVELSERAADHVVEYRDLDCASGEAERIFEDHFDLDEADPRIQAAHIASYASSPDMRKELVLDVATGLEPAVALIRDIFGNPFRPVTLDPRWLPPTVASLALAAYDERLLPSGELDTVRLCILADALEEAGCTDDTLLSHLRSPGPHVRGCWALDSCLGRT